MKNVLLISHTDLDGYASQFILYTLLNSCLYNFEFKNLNYEDVDNYLLEFFNYKSFYGNIYDRFMTGSILENNRIKAFNISQANTSSGSIGGTYTKNV
jgi:oligoribonuclease NrnB/cAMP/cGMP phosphodiesterase (DHH superfamily)